MAWPVLLKYVHALIHLTVFTNFYTKIFYYLNELLCLSIFSDKAPENRFDRVLKKQSRSTQGHQLINLGCTCVSDATYQVAKQ